MLSESERKVSALANFTSCAAVGWTNGLGVREGGGGGFGSFLCEPKGVLGRDGGLKEPDGRGGIGEVVCDRSAAAVAEAILREGVLGGCGIEMPKPELVSSPV